MAVQQYSDEKHFHQLVIEKCDKFLINKIGCGWNDLPDNVSIFDWIDGSTLPSDISWLVQDLCWEKLADEYPGTRCELTTLIYGECSCGFCDDKEDDD